MEQNCGALRPNGPKLLNYASGQTFVFIKRQCYGIGQAYRELRIDCQHLNAVKSECLRVCSCGYGTISSSAWPGFNVASISINSTLFSDPGSPKEGCGRCIEVQCDAKAVRYRCILPVDSASYSTSSRCLLPHVHINVSRNTVGSQGPCPPGAAPLILQVQDRCNSCPPFQFNIPYIVWSQSLASNPNSGTVPVMYRRVRSF